MAKKTGLETARVSIANISLEWIRIRCADPRGLLFIPPLIGGGFSQQAGVFRRLVRQGYDLVSFNYSGHGNSSGDFSPGAALRDTRVMLRLTSRIGKRESLPIVGIGSCYSTIPLVHAADYLGEPLQQVVLINPITKLCPVTTGRSFFSYYRNVCRAHGKLGKISDALENYLEFLFPGIFKDREYFGGLARKRTRLIKTVMEFLLSNPLGTARISKTPVLCLYAREDRILDMLVSGKRTEYENSIRKICPRTVFHVLDGDHFLSFSRTRGEALQKIMAFLGLSRVEPANI